MIDIDVFLPNIMTVAPGCAVPKAYDAIRQAVMQFCEATRSWRSEDTFDVTPDTCAFICVPDQAELFEIELVTFNGAELETISTMELDRREPNWRKETEYGMGNPRYFTQTAMDAIQVVPRGTGTVKVHAFLKPSEDAEQVPAFIANKYRRVIVSGALAEILLTPGQPFFSPDLAGIHNGRFQAALNRNFNMNVRGQQRAPTRTRAQFL